MHKQIYFIENAHVKYELAQFYLEDYKILNHNVKTALKSVNWFRFAKRLNSVHLQCKLGTMEGLPRARYSGGQYELKSGRRRSWTT